MADADADTPDTDPYVDLARVPRSESARLTRKLNRDYMALVREWTAGSASVEFMELVVRVGQRQLGGEMREALRLSDDPTVQEVLDRFNLVRFGWGPDQVDPPSGEGN